MFTSVMQAFVVFNAVGVQEDAIGRIVGANRGVTEVGAWFTPDSAYYAVPDSGPPVWVNNAPLGGNLTMDDTSYRNAIFAKVFRNFVQSASVTDIQDFIFDLYGINSSVVITGPNQVKIVVPAGTSPQIISFLGASFSNNQCDTIYNVPLPPGVQIAEVVASAAGFGSQPYGEGGFGE